MNYGAGALGGGIDSIFTMPFDTIKTQMQLNKQMGSSPIVCARQILVHDGVKGLYRGYLPFGVMACGKAGIRWGTVLALEGVVDACGVDRKPAKARWSFLCGFGGGIVEALVWTAPAERLKVLRQRSVGLKMHTVSYKEIFAAHGISGLWKGATPTCMRSATNGAVRFAVADTVKGFYKALFGLDPSFEATPPYVSLLSGATGGAISTMCNHPFDVIKTKFQAGFEGGWLACGKAIVKERGFVGFASGLSSRLPQIMISQAVQFAVVDFLRSIKSRGS